MCKSSQKKICTKIAQILGKRFSHFVETLIVQEKRRNVNKKLVQENKSNVTIKEVQENRRSVTITVVQ